MRIIFHIDVNNAFLSWTAVKMLAEGNKLDIRKIPSVIGGDESLRHGVVLAKSPIAKKYGITTAETLFSARKKYPGLKVYLPDHQYYQEVSNKLFTYLATYSPDIEIYSIDECFLDFSYTKYLYDDLEMLAYHIKDEVEKRFKFTVNIGIANNKLLAKMASDFSKPNQVHTLYKEEIATKMWPLDVSKLFMVGRKTADKLKSLNILTIYDLAHTNPLLLKKYFKSFGKTLYEYAHGIDDDEVCSIISKNKCISSTRTMVKDTNDIELLKKELLEEAHTVGVELRKINEYATVVALIIKTFDFRNFTKQKTLDNPINTDDEIYKTAIYILESLNIEDKIRNIGIRVSNFTNKKYYQTSIFDDDKKDIIKVNKIQKTVDEINKKMGKEVVKPASLIEKE